MKILYGVVGEGMGHAMRSRVVLDHLTGLREDGAHGAGHEIMIMASGRAVDYLKKHFGDDVSRIHGLHMIYEDNRVRMGKTIWSNVLAGATGVPKNIAAYFDLIRDFKPEVAISDFESWTYLYAKTHRLPILSIDNMQIINRCWHDRDVIGDNDADFQLSRAFVKSKLPFCDAYFISTFFRPRIRKEKTWLFPPIVRPEIQAAKRAQKPRGEHLLVYQTAEGHDALARALEASGLECRVYGMRRNLQGDLTEGNLTHRPFSETTFIEDLATARGVIAGGGFTLMSESVYLQRPMLAVPLQKQFEQVLNARYLEKEGFGMATDAVERPGVLESFIANLPRYEEKLAGYTQDGNAEIFAATDEWLDKAAAGVA